MGSIASVTFQIDSWDEEPFDEYEGGRKLTRTVVQKKYSGDFVGRGSLEYLMVYTEEGSASFVGVERMEGSLRGRAGSFVLQHVGTYKEGISKESLHIVPGSASGELQGLKGDGIFESGHAQEYTFTLDCSFEFED